MFQNAHAIVGLIELTNASPEAATMVDDSTLDRLLESLVSHDSLADELQLRDRGLAAYERQRIGDKSPYFGRASVSADLAALVEDLEREYAQLYESLDG